MKKFQIPAYYRSAVTGRLKESRRLKDLRKQDFSPSVLDFGPVQFVIARHFGFCYGVENAIEISYKAIEENPGKKIYLLSQIIHNQEVNRDLESRGAQFILDTDGTPLVPWDAIGPNDVVIIPAFGTTLETEAMLLDRGVEIQHYNTTCPFVEKVWNRAYRLAKDGYTILIHGKPAHEETRATFSHSASRGPAVVIRNMAEAGQLAAYIGGTKTASSFYQEFAGRHSQGFNPDDHLRRVGVVNQTTMLATETQAIADFIKEVMIRRFGPADIKNHFADTRDTLCYATNDNQDATYELLKSGADLALVVGGYNSSNTSHLAALCGQYFPTYFINSNTEIKSPEEIHHYDYGRKEKKVTHGFLPARRPLRLVLTSGASCPDTLIDRVMLQLLDYFPGCRPLDEVMQEHLR